MDNMSDAPSLLTMPEVMARLRIGKSKLIEMMKAGRIPSIRVGQRGTRFLSSDIDQVILAGRVQPCANVPKEESPHVQ